MKTSLTHPLPLPAVSAGKGRIAFCMCPGKVQPHAVTGPWHRDLIIDMDAIAAFGARYLVTLMEMHELDKAVPAADLDAAAAARGIAWMHLPIVDLQVPDEAFEELWKTRGQTLCDALRAGENVVVHCRGGRGRSGLVAARLMIELGEDPGAALLAVRAANPFAVETPVQEHFVKNACRRGSR